uniref:C2H2-type domain-containing protein n=1 Tax=Labrus bergylta TaxID=56723 RepID=A0A3Q3F5T5_9LABR
MSKAKTLKCFVKQRLTAAAEEIFELFEKTISEYEEQMCQLKEENERQHKLLEAVSKAGLYFFCDGQRLQEPWDTDIIKFTFTPVPVKSEDDDKKPQSSELHEDQTEESRDTQHLKTADGEDYRYLTPTSQHIISNSTESEMYDRCFDRVVTTIPLRIQTEVKPFRCSICGKRFSDKVSLINHVSIHSEQKRFSCSVCKKRFHWKKDILTHMRTHTGEKPYSCSYCGSGFTQSSHLVAHLKVHTGEKPFTCLVCSASFSIKKSLVEHMRIHTGEKPFDCSVCGKRFAQKGHMRRHLTVHTGERPFICSELGINPDPPVKRRPTLLHVQPSVVSGLTAKGTRERSLFCVDPYMYLCSCRKYIFF